ncbi:hypothetical protein [Kaarinaea lacus]
MAGFFKKLFSGSQDERSANRPGKTAAALNAGGPIEVARFTEFLRYFPPGGKVRYYPQYVKEATLNTIVLGYGVNNQYIYSPVDIRHQADGDRDVIRLNVDGHEILVRKIENFCFLIPCNRNDHNRLDVESKARLGPQGPFRTDNTISLVACSAGGTLSYVDTVVRKVISLTSGIYAGHEVVVLDVIPDSLQLTDQRQHYRLHTRIPATLTINDRDVCQCTLRDLSEESVRLEFEDASEELAALTASQHLTLMVNFGTGSQPKEYVLDGVMYRKTDTSLVVKLQGIHKDNAVLPIDLVDVLDIKANLLQHPATQKAMDDMRNT